MLLILNSDLLYTMRLVRERLPTHLERLGNECTKVGATLVVPRTTLLEVQRRQRELMEQESAELQRARDLLAAYGVNCGDLDLSRLVVEPDLVDLLRRTGATVEVIDPTVEDYRVAEERAAFHLPPLRPGSEHDEMRDLVIWAVSCRIAGRDGGAVLLSKDEVHVGRWGNEEATRVGLQRVKGVDEALDILGIESPPARLARTILAAHWSGARAAGVPIPPEVSIRRVDDATFVQGEARLASARFRIRALAANGKPLNARISISAEGERRLKFAISELSVEGMQVEPEFSFAVDGTMPETVTDVSERLADLRSVLEEQ